MIVWLGVIGCFHASIAIGMGVILLITNRLNKQIIPQTKVLIIKAIMNV